MKGRSTVATLLVIGSAACSLGPNTGPSSIVVTYQLVTTGAVTCDSVKYDNGHGVLQKVSAPGAAWTAGFGAEAGATVEVFAWGQAAGAGSATLRVIWTGQGLVTQGDSSSTTLSGAGSFALVIPRRTL